jgi:uncharacterized protein YndB with AHSA1/START domain
MARGETFIAAPQQEVFELLADPRTYEDWVVGSRLIRAADENWPAPGAGFDHQVGVPPLVISDETVVLASDPPRCLEVHAKARPLPSALVRFELRPEASRGPGGRRIEGTRVTMIENFANPLLNLMAGPLGHGAMRLRNRECLRRLRALAENPKRDHHEPRSLPPRRAVSR